MKAKDTRKSYLYCAPLTTAACCAVMGPFGLLIGPFAAFALMNDSGAFNNDNK